MPSQFSFGSVIFVDRVRGTDAYQHKSLLDVDVTRQGVGANPTAVSKKVQGDCLNRIPYPMEYGDSGEPVLGAAGQNKHGDVRVNHAS